MVAWKNLAVNGLVSQELQIYTHQISNDPDDVNQQQCANDNHNINWHDDSIERVLCTQASTFVVREYTEPKPFTQMRSQYWNNWQQ